jgi:hypothetical protein
MNNIIDIKKYRTIPKVKNNNVKHFKKEFRALIESVIRMDLINAANIRLGMSEDNSEDFIIKQTLGYLDRI